MNERLTVGVSLSSRSWRGNLQRHCRDHESDIAVVLLHQGAEALNGSIDVLVVDDDTSWLSVPFVQSVRSSGIAMIGLFDPDDADGYGRRQLQHFGIDTTLDCTIDCETMVDVIRRHRRDPEMDRRFAGLLADTGVAAPATPTVQRIIAVGGPAGAGATEVCLALAADWNVGRPLVIDVDETHPTLARRLGLALHPHLLTAVDAHRHEPLTLDVAERADLRQCLARSVDTSATPLSFDVIAGLATRDDWSLVRADDVVALVEHCATEWPAVFVRLGPSLEDLQRHVSRFELSRRSASTADHLIGVCDASASGLLRFVDWLVDALGLIGDGPVDVVLNRAPRSPSQRGQLIDQLRSVAGDRVGHIVCAPGDRRVTRASWDAGVPAWGPFRRAIAEVGPTDDSSRGRQRWLAMPRPSRRDGGAPSGEHHEEASAPIVADERAVS